VLRRHIVLAVLVYVVIDFGNPLIPGAVSFDVDQSVDGLHADRGRAATPVAAEPCARCSTGATVPVVWKAQSSGRPGRPPRRPGVVRTVRADAAGPVPSAEDH